MSSSICLMLVSFFAGAPRRLCGGRGGAVVTGRQRNPFVTVTTLVAAGADQIQLTSVKLLSCDSSHGTHTVITGRPHNACST